ncbi:nucleotidyltransferase domain-containing protein, partial [Candidatus Marithrix sp. Canyon 246]
MADQIMLAKKLTGLLLNNAQEFKNLSYMEWDVLLRSAIKHGIAALLYKRVKNLDNIPKDILAALSKAYYTNLLRNFSYYQELSEIIKQLHENEIEVIVLKGAYLAKTVYESDALRFIGDMDLMVKSADLSKTQNLLLQLGYKQNLTDFKKQGAFNIDLHWNFHFTPDTPFKINPEMLWQAAQPCTIGNIKAQCLSPEDLLFHACSHAAYANNFGSMRFLYDIQKTIAYYEIDWNLLFKRASEWKAEKVVYLALYIAKDCLAAEVPDKVLNEFKPKDFNLELVTITKEIISFNINYQLSSINLATLWMINKPLREKLSIIINRTLLSPKSLAALYNLPTNSWRVYFY